MVLKLVFTQNAWLKKTTLRTCHSKFFQVNSETKKQPCNDQTPKLNAHTRTLGLMYDEKCFETSVILTQIVDTAKAESGELAMICNG